MLTLNNQPEWLDWAKETGYIHPAVIQWIEISPHIFDKVSPYELKKLSNIINLVEGSEEPQND